MSYFSLVSETAYVLEWPREKLYWDGWVSRKKPQGISTTSIGFVVEKTNFIGIISGKEIFSIKIIDAKESELPRIPAACHGFQFKTATERTHLFMSKEVNMASPINPLCLIKQLTRCISIFYKCVCLFNSFSILPLQNDAIIILSNLIFKYQLYCQRNDVASHSFNQHMNYRDSVFIHLFRVPKRIS